MNVSELRAALAAGTSCEAWAGAVDRFFRAHELSYGHGTDNATDEAYWLLRGLQGWDPAAWSEKPAPDLADAVAELARRRVSERRPLAYLLGEAWFAGLRFRVDERVLVPRSPLAELIERGFAPWCRLRPGERILDVGTGSGCVAVAAAHHCPGVTVDATDISEAALAVAASNVEAHGLGDRVRLLQCDLFPVAGERYRLVVSNPPYVPREKLRMLPAEYAHEPASALDGGEGGLDLVERLLHGAAERLVPGGLLIVEVGEAMEAFAAAHRALPLTWLEFQRGGEGVFLLTRDELTGYLGS